MDIYKALEIVGLLVGFLYLILIIRQNIWCWIFGIIGSLITIFLFFHSKLYLESFLNIYYVWAGIYGWVFWSQKKQEAPVPVVTWTIMQHLVGIVAALVLSIAVGVLMKKYTDSPRPYLDTLLAVFSFLATYMEARKVLSAWLFWLVINGVSIWLQFDRGLPYYAALSAVYTVMCVPGYMEWKKSYLSTHILS